MYQNFILCLIFRLNLLKYELAFYLTYKSENTSPVKTKNDLTIESNINFKKMNEIQIR